MKEEPVFFLDVELLNAISLGLVFLLTFKFFVLNLVWVEVKLVDDNLNFMCRYLLSVYSLVSFSYLYFTPMKMELSLFFNLAFFIECSS